jgi:hypothetical protein
MMDKVHSILRFCSMLVRIDIALSLAMTATLLLYLNWH